MSPLVNKDDDPQNEGDADQNIQCHNSNNLSLGPRGALSPSYWLPPSRLKPGGLLLLSLFDALPCLLRARRPSSRSESVEFGSEPLPQFPEFRGTESGVLETQQPRSRQRHSGRRTTPLLFSWLRGPAEGKGNGAWKLSQNPTALIWPSPGLLD